jgi:hypothetical protein
MENKVTRNRKMIQKMMFLSKYITSM